MSIHTFVIQTEDNYLPHTFIDNINDKSQRWNNSTPLILALYLGKINLAKDIFYKGADVLLRNNFGNALHYAMGNHCNRDLDLVYKILDMYLEEGGDIDFVDNITKSSYLHYAMKYSMELSQYLIDLGINVHIPDVYGYTAIHYCCSLNFMNIANIDGLDGEGLFSLPDFMKYGIFYNNMSGDIQNIYEDICGISREDHLILFDKLFDLNVDLDKKVSGKNLLTYCVDYYFPDISDRFIKRLINENISVQDNTMNRYHMYPEEYSEIFLDIMNNYFD